MGFRIADLKSQIPDPISRNRIGARGRIRTFINLFLRQAPLPVGLRVRLCFWICVWECGFEIPDPQSQIPDRTGPGSRIRTCEHLLPRQAHVAICGTPGDMDFGVGIADFGFDDVQYQIRNPSSQIEMASGKGFEPPFAGSKPAVLPLDDPEKIFELRFAICDLSPFDSTDAPIEQKPTKIENRNSKIENWRRRKDSNPQPSRSKRDALIPLSYVSKKTIAKNCTGKDSNLHSSDERQFYRLPALTNRRPVR